MYYNNINFENRNYEDNSKYINIEQGMNAEEDKYNDPFNPKWFLDNDNDKIDYSQKDIELISQKIKNYCEKNNVRKNYLEFCDNNSDTLQSIKNFKPF